MPDIADGSNILKTDVIKGMSGHLAFKNFQVDADIGDDLTEDYSYVQLANNDHAQISLQAGGKLRTDSASDTSINVGRNKIENVLGDSDITVGRDNHVTIEGKLAINIGRMGSKEKEAYKKLTALSKNIQEQAISQAKATTKNKIPCPICSSKILEQPASVTFKVQGSRIVNLMQTANTGWKHMKNFFKKIVWFIPDIFRKAQTKSYHQNGSCGSPGCKDHMVTDLKQSLDAYNKKATDLLEINKSEIEKLQQQLGQGTGGLTLITKGTCFVSTGLEKNKSPTVWEDGNHTMSTKMVKTTKGTALSSKGSPKRTVQVGAIRLTEGDMYLNSSEKFTVNAGAPGISFMSNGPLDSRTSTVEIRATEGEAHFSSGNLTVVSGTVVKIQGGDKSGDTGIVLDSQNVHVAGGLTIQGNLVMKGGAHFDGEITAPMLNVPTHEQGVYPSKPPQDITAPSSWYPVNVLFNTLQELNDNTQRITPDPLHICQPRILIEYTKKWYGEVMSAIPLELSLTGWSLVMTVGVTTCAVGAGVAFSMGAMNGFCPVFNVPHNHTKHNEYHSGEVTLPLMKGHDLVQGANSMSVQPSHIPVPPNTKTFLGTRPGPYSMPGPCGGGGMFNKARNQEYGIDAEDPFQGQNFVNRPVPYQNSYNVDYSFIRHGIPALTGNNVNVDCD